MSHDVYQIPILLCISIPIPHSGQSWCSDVYGEHNTWPRDWGYGDL